MIFSTPAAAGEGASVTVCGRVEGGAEAGWGNGMSSGCPKALGYPHRDYISVAQGWPAASLPRGVNAVNCPKQPRATCEGREVQRH